MKSVGKKNGFTLVELLVALMIASVVLSAVATLASATGSAAEITDQVGREQAQLRHMTVRLTDLIQRANALLSVSVNEFLLWHDVNKDGYSTYDELVRIRTDAGNGIEIVDRETYTNCSNVQFGYDAADESARMVSIWFDVEENGQTQTYTISARLRASDDHKLF